MADSFGTMPQLGSSVNAWDGMEEEKGSIEEEEIRERTNGEKGPIKEWEKRREGGKEGTPGHLHVSIQESMYDYLHTVDDTAMHSVTIMHRYVEA